MRSWNHPANTEAGTTAHTTAISAQPCWNERVNSSIAVASLERDAELMLRVRDGDQASFGLLLESIAGR